VLRRGFEQVTTVAAALRAQRELLSKTLADEK
jgi:hypothetical protein